MLNLCMGSSSAPCIIAARGAEGRPPQSHKIPLTSFQKATEGSPRQSALLRVSSVRDRGLWQWVTDGKNHKVDLWDTDGAAGEEDPRRVTRGRPAMDLVCEQESHDCQTNNKPKPTPTLPKPSFDFAIHQLRVHEDDKDLGVQDDNLGNTI